MVMALLMMARICTAAEVESQVKAALVPKIANFVEWPESAFRSKDAPLVVAVVGTDPFGLDFEALLKQQQIHSRPVVVKRYTTWGATNDCHILIVGRSEAQRIDLILRRLGDRPVLTLGDFAGFAEQGGVVNFIKVDGRIRFEVNLEAADKHRLRVSARLLQVSRVVRSSGNSNEK
jgi:hypothetical protein